MTEIFKEFSFEAAHWLPNVSAGHKCGRLHGHSYKAVVSVSGAVGGDTGWVMDFGDLKEICAPVIAELDHCCLNEVPGLENPTSELLAEWLWRRLHGSLPLLSSIEVRETCTSGCLYRGPNGQP